MKIKPFHRVASLLTVFLFLFLLNGCAGDGDGNTDSGQTEKSSPAESNQKSDKIEILETKVKDESAKKDLRMKPHLVIGCKIKNKSDKTATIVSLKSIYFNEKKEQVGSGYGNANDLGPGETTTVNIRANKNVKNPKNYEVKVLNANFK